MSAENKPVIKTVAMVAAEENKLKFLKSLVRAKADLTFDVRTKGGREGRDWGGRGQPIDHVGTHVGPHACESMSSHAAIVGVVVGLSAGSRWDVGAAFGCIQLDSAPPWWWSVTLSALQHLLTTSICNTPRSTSCN